MPCGTYLTDEQKELIVHKAMVKKEFNSQIAKNMGLSRRAVAAVVHKAEREAESNK
jgi:FixJ family two-component response regulator